MSDGARHAFTELLKYWRARRGFSQLELSLAAEVSARHVSFLETGRSRPSEEMVWQLGHVLDLPIRHQNELLVAAGFPPRFPESTAIDALAGPLGSIVETILRSNEPFPTMVLNRQYWILAANDATTSLFAAFGATEVVGMNLVKAIFAPGAASVILNWDDVAGDALRRLHREVLYAPDDLELSQIFDDAKQRATLTHDWWREGFDRVNEPALPLIVRDADGAVTSFLATTTTFNAPRNTALDELLIETWYRTKR